MNDFTKKQQMDLEYFKANLPAFLDNNLLKHKYIVIHDQKIQRSFDTIESAVVYAIENFQRGEYIIQQVVNENEVINFVRAAII